MITFSEIKPYDFTNVRLKYATHRKFISRLVLPITRYLRARNVERYLTPGGRILDIGCGDGYFLERNLFMFDECIGMDRLFGDEVVKTLPFEDNSFDWVTMLAVIEHFEHPWEIVSEIRRILKPGGKLIFTTPKEKAEWLINLYVKEIHDEHKFYFDENIVREKAEGFKLLDYKTFIFGLNQVFYLEKI